MMSVSRRLFHVGFLGALVAAIAGSAPAAPRWEIEVLPSLSTRAGVLNQIWARDINERGQVAGTAETFRASAAFRYTPGVGMEDLDPDGHYRSRVFVGGTINNRGEVLGRTFDRHRRQRDVFLYRGPKRGFDDLSKGKTALVAAGFEIFGGQTFIPDDGHLCGSVTFTQANGQFSRRAYLYTRRKGWIDLSSLSPRFPAEQSVYCKYTNQRGDLVLSIAVPGGGQEAFVRIGRTPVVEIPSLDLNENVTAEPNDRGMVVGINRTAVGDDPIYNLRAYVWTPDSGLIGIHPDGIGESQALLVTDRSEVWGILSTDGIVQTADGHLVGYSDKVFLYRPSKGLKVVLDKDDFEAITRRHGREFANMTLTGANNRGAVVGYVRTSPSGLLPFYYSRRSGLVDLKAVVDELDADFALGPESMTTFVIDVNDRGDVLLTGNSRSLGTVSSAILHLRRR